MAWTVQRVIKWLNVLDDTGNLRFQVAFDVEPDYRRAIQDDVDDLVECFNSARALLEHPTDDAAWSNLREAARSTGSRDQAMENQ